MTRSTPWRSAWTIPDDVSYLNHGSFGPSPVAVQEQMRQTTARLERQPMQFLLRDLEGELIAVERTLEQWLNAQRGSIVCVTNATVGMNAVAHSVALQPGDVVALTDHEYGAVSRIWRTTCDKTGARLWTEKLPSGELPEDWPQQWVDRLPKETRLIVISHVTSPTALVLPVAEMCRAARQRGMLTCIDGPHALAMVDVDLRNIGCDFYVASCHKWLSAGFGSGLLYVAPAHRGTIRSPLTSWGKSLSGRPPDWRDEFRWLGTHNPAPFLSIPAALEFMTAQGFDTFREHARNLLSLAEKGLAERFGLENDLPPLPFGTMRTFPLPDSVPPREKPNDPHPLQLRLWHERKIEVPIVEWNNRRWLRISAHLYTSEHDIERLLAALAEFTAASG